MTTATPSIARELAPPAVCRELAPPATRRWACEPNAVAYGKFTGVDVEQLDDAAYFDWNDTVDFIHCPGCSSECRAYEFRRFGNGRNHVRCIRCSDARHPRCAHGVQRDKCAPCGGSLICVHGRQRQTCRDCGGSSFCEHGRLRNTCRPCGGASRCEHGSLRHNCVRCNGGGVCAHAKVRRACQTCDPAGHLRSVVSSRVHSALKGGKDRGTLDYLGCSIAEFRAHIEGTFTAGMTWETYGTWHIDHVVPVMFPVDGAPPSLEVVAERLHWRNTQALWAAENLAKGNRWIG